MSIADGYYLSVYITPQGVGAELDIWLRHDANASLWRVRSDAAELLAHWELERSTGVKHDGRGPRSAEDLVREVGDFLSEFDLTWDDISATWGTPGLPRYSREEIPAPVADFPVHSVGHLFSGLLLSSVLYLDDNIIGLAVDGGPDDVLDARPSRYFYVGASVRHGTLSACPIQSPGAIFEHAAERYGLAEGSLMALASSVRELQIPAEFPLQSFYGPEAHAVSAQRILDDLEELAGAQEGEGDGRFTSREQFVGAVATGLQEVAYRIVAGSVRRVLEIDKVDPGNAYLSMTGGVALNCPINSRLIDEFGFKGLLSPPFVNDGGQSVGLALAYLAADKQNVREFTYPGPYIGRRKRGAFDIEHSEFADFVIDESDFDGATAVADIVEAPIVWIDGRSESGPRALGHRSVLADPRSEDSRVALNRIKRRQWWRPVAPVVMEEYQRDWFEDGTRSPYMLRTFTVRPEKAHLIPAVVHLDGSARLQTLSPDDDERLWGLLSAFRVMTDAPMLCNTSLNDKGEPIVETPEQGLNFALRRGINIVYVDGRRLVLARHQEYPVDGPLLRNDSILGASRERTPTYGLTELELMTIVVSPQLRGSVDEDIRDDEKRARLQRKLARLYEYRPDLEDLVRWRARVRPHV